MHTLFLALYRLLYERVARPLIFRFTPQQSHILTLQMLAWLDDHPWTHFLLRWSHDLAFIEHPLMVGGVRLTHPLILAAGFVKGEGFADEKVALKAAASRNIIPGWCSLPLLVGAIEFGSFTRCPRPGNPGIVLWRDELSFSTQNRVGLKNPGAIAAAEFLSLHKRQLPDTFGINIAVSPGVTDPAQERREVLESLAAFWERGVQPSWFTLNLSCPNTEDDPGSRQTETRARDLCTEVSRYLQPYSIPLWVKISPDLAVQQYQALLRVFVDTGVRAVIATNTLGAPAPDGTLAGLGGGKLYQHAFDVVALLDAEKRRCGYQIDIIGCGGVQDGQSARAFAQRGALAMQYWSALVYRGPLAAALIAEESNS